VVRGFHGPPFPYVWLRYWSGNREWLASEMGGAWNVDEGKVACHRVQSGAPIQRLADLSVQCPEVALDESACWTM